jgi:ABC-type molybdenum transport system ATPase subunit/photorepair protein PhrA
VKTPKEQSPDSLGSRASDDKTTTGFLGQPSYEGVVEHGVVLGGLHDVTKSFGAVVAIQGVSFELRSGKVLALPGENGAGKSTCVKVLAGPRVDYQGVSGQHLSLRKCSRCAAWQRCSCRLASPSLCAVI